MIIKIDQLPIARVRVHGSDIVFTMQYIAEQKLSREYHTGCGAIEAHGESLTDIVSWAEGIMEQCEALDSDLSPNTVAGMPF